MAEAGVDDKNASTWPLTIEVAISIILGVIEQFTPEDMMPRAVRVAIVFVCYSLLGAIAVQLASRMIPRLRGKWPQRWAWTIYVLCIAFAAVVVGLRGLTETPPDAIAPRISQAVSKVSVRLASQVGFTIPRSRLEGEGYALTEGGSLRLHLRGERVLVDAELWGGSDVPDVRIKENRVELNASGLDLNYNDWAMEVVRGETVLFQLIRIHESELEVRGLFRSQNGMVTLATDDRTLVNFSPESIRFEPPDGISVLLQGQEERTTIAIPRLFAYPSRGNLGRLADD